MDAPNAPPETLSPPETAAEAPEGAGRAPYSYRDAEPGPAAVAGGTQAGQEIQPLDYSTRSQNLASLG